MTTIINLTQHQPTAEQVAAGVVNLRRDLLESLNLCLNFEAQYAKEDLELSAKSIIALLFHNGSSGVGQRVMVGGMPSFMLILEKTLLQAGFRVLYAKTDRISEDQPQEDGTVRKISVFKHIGFYEAE